MSFVCRLFLYILRPGIELPDSERHGAVTRMLTHVQTAGFIRHTVEMNIGALNAQTDGSELSNAPNDKV